MENKQLTPSELHALAIEYDSDDFQVMRDRWANAWLWLKEHGGNKEDFLVFTMLLGCLNEGRIRLEIEGLKAELAEHEKMLEEIQQLQLDAQWQPLND